MRILRAMPGGLLYGWVPRLRLVGNVAANAVGPVAIPSAQDLAAERAEQLGPPILGAVGLPARVSGGGNLRFWPAVRRDTLLRTLAHNAPVRVISSVEGDEGDLWYAVDSLDAATQDWNSTGSCTTRRCACRGCAQIAPQIARRQDAGWRPTCSSRPC